MKRGMPSSSSVANKKRSAKMQEYNPNGDTLHAPNVQEANRHRRLRSIRSIASAALLVVQHHQHQEHRLPLRDSAQTRSRGRKL